ncbi:MAG TPA: hypothetical protein VHF92_13515 [Geodermatophilus sp.]|nr:hypothetical protein [Geodermatophilus sp.]
MTCAAPSRWRGVAAALGLVVAGALLGCARAVDGVATAAPAPPTPDSPEELEALLVTDVPSGLPRVPDDVLHPPAGEKTVHDVAGYAEDPEREREVLEDYGYRFGWERFWSSGSGPLTSVFIDQFENRAGAGAYAEDLAANDAEHYEGVLREDPPHLPGGCRLLVVEDPDPASGLAGPAVFAWCGRGVFSVSVSAVAESVTAASDEVHTVLQAQLDRLPT